MPVVVGGVPIREVSAFVTRRMGYPPCFTVTLLPVLCLWVATTPKEVSCGVGWGSRDRLYVCVCVRRSTGHGVQRDTAVEEGRGGGDSSDSDSVPTHPRPQYRPLTSDRCVSSLGDGGVS